MGNRELRGSMLKWTDAHEMIIFQKFSLFLFVAAFASCVTIANEALYLSVSS